MNAMCSLAIVGLPDFPCDFFRQNSRNFRFLHRITVSGFTKISSEAQSFQILDGSDQIRRSLFRSVGFLDLRLHTASW